MQMLKRVALLATAVLGALTLSGCGALSTLTEIGENLRAANQRRAMVEDANTESAIKTASGFLSYRVAFVQEVPKTLFALEASCLKGNTVELLVYASQTLALKQYALRCVTVYTSDDGNLVNSDDILVVNGVDVWANGAKSFPTPAQMSQEYAFRRQSKQFAMNRY